MSSPSPRSSGSRLPQQLGPRVAARGRLAVALQRLPGRRRPGAWAPHVDGDQQVARRSRRVRRTPLPRTRKVRPFGVPAGIRSADRRRRRCDGTLISAPSAASGNVTGTVRVRLSPCGRTPGAAVTCTRTYRSPAGPPRSPGAPLPLSLIRCPSADAGRDARLDGPGAHRPAAARAHRARVVDHQPAAPALPARLGEREAAQVPAGLRRCPRRSGRPAARCRPWRRCPRRSRRAPRRPAGATRSRPSMRVAERQRHLGLDVGAAPRPRPARCRCRPGCRTRRRACRRARRPRCCSAVPLPNRSPRSNVEAAAGRRPCPGIRTRRCRTATAPRRTPCGASRRTATS